MVLNENHGTETNKAEHQVILMKEAVLEESQKILNKSLDIRSGTPLRF